MPEGDVYSISAVTGEGVLELVRGARARLDAMPAEPMTLQVCRAAAELAAWLGTPCRCKSRILYASSQPIATAFSWQPCDDPTSVGRNLSGMLGSVFLCVVRFADQRA